MLTVEAEGDEEPDVYDIWKQFVKAGKANSDVLDVDTKDLSPLD